MKLKEMEEMAKQARKTSTREGSLCARTATSFFTCRCGAPDVSTHRYGREGGDSECSAINETGGGWQRATLSA